MNNVLCELPALIALVTLAVLLAAGLLWWKRGGRGPERLAFVLGMVLLVEICLMGGFVAWVGAASIAPFLVLAGILMGLTVAAKLQDAETIGKDDDYRRTATSR